MTYIATAFDDGRIDVHVHNDRTGKCERANRGPSPHSDNGWYDGSSDEGMRAFLQDWSPVGSMPMPTIDFPRENVDNLVALASQSNGQLTDDQLETEALKITEPAFVLKGEVIPNT